MIGLGELLDGDQAEALVREPGLRPAAARTKAELFGRAARRLAEGGVGPQTRVAAFAVPGRVEVLGKHTDYAGGRSLVAALEQGFCMVATPRSDTQVRIWAEQGEPVSFALDPELVASHGHWSNYPITVARRLARNFPACRRGMDLAFCSDLPPAAGMSSSSALMVGTYLALAAFNQLDVQPQYRRQISDPLELAAFLGTVENGQSFGELEGDRGVGTFGGSEDHTAILCSRAGHIGQFAYCPARFERHIPVPEGYLFALGSSGVVAEKTGAAQELYNRASARVRALVRAWQRGTGGTQRHLYPILHSGPGVADRLRQLIAGPQEGPFSSAELRDRLEHFIAENEEICLPAGEALARGDLEGFGRLVDRSQELTETLLGNQVPQTAALARLAREGGAVAASAFGAGFGGSVWALVPEDGALAFLDRWARAYAGAFPDATGAFFLSQAGPAAFALSGLG
ncbi:MAG: galactokinase [Candidatus Handelsmanbacteria bacterium]|nr:galactokinase [Candidatus Handelsmanbacteria bacterium]